MNLKNVLQRQSRSIHIWYVRVKEKVIGYADECGLTEEQALKLGGCFGDGMRKGEVCGACTGALLVLVVSMMNDL